MMSGEATQTIEQRARELLARQLEIGLYHDDAERVRAAQDGLGVICAASAIAALAEALARVEELEGALNRIVAKDSYINSTIRSDSPNGERLVIYGDIADIARTTLSKGITE